MKRFNIFIFSIGILLVIFIILIDLFTSFYLPFVRNYISFIFYLSVFIYWLNDKEFNLKYFSCYFIISIYINFLLTTTLFYVLFNELFSIFFIIYGKFFNITLIGISTSLLNSFLYNHFKFKSYSQYRSLL